MKNEVKQHIFIIGSKGIPAQYGGYETFVEKLTQYQQDDSIQYHVACAVDSIDGIASESEYNGAKCFNIKWRKIGSARAIFYDVDAMRWSIRYIKKHKIEQPIVYVLACRMGPFFKHYVKQVHMLNGKVFVNPDGHEWMRAKWSVPIRKYWKVSESMMVHYADLLICDSKNIEMYVHKEYGRYNPNTTFIAYGAETSKSLLHDDDSKLLTWYAEKDVSVKEYYLVVGRFVPENNYETMIREFMRSKSKKDFLLITNVSGKFLAELKEKTQFDRDKRIKFVGTVYDSDLLKKIRENAYGYLHGHEVGGTNPSLLEALSSTDLNLLLDVGFNREVGEEGALYWKKDIGALEMLIEKADAMSDEEIEALGRKAHKRITDWYNWNFIVNRYEKMFLVGGDNEDIDGEQVFLY